jgi:hypothetical protein
MGDITAVDAATLHCPARSRAGGPAARNAYDVVTPSIRDDRARRTYAREVNPYSGTPSIARASAVPPALALAQMEASGRTMHAGVASTSTMRLPRVSGHPSAGQELSLARNDQTGPCPDPPRSGRPLIIRAVSKTACDGAVVLGVLGRRIGSSCRACYLSSQG